MDLGFESTLGESYKSDLGPFSALAALNVDATHGVEGVKAIDCEVIGVKSLLLKIYYLFDIKKPVQAWIYSTVSQGRKRLRVRLKKDKELQGLMGRIEEKMSKVKI